MRANGRHEHGIVNCAGDDYCMIVARIAEGDWLLCIGDTKLREQQGVLPVLFKIPHTPQHKLVDHKSCRRFWLLNNGCQYITTKGLSMPEDVPTFIDATASISSITLSRSAPYVSQNWTKVWSWLANVWSCLILVKKAEHSKTLTASIPRLLRSSCVMWENDAD